MKKKQIILGAVVFLLLFITGATVHAAPANLPVPRVNISVDGANTPADYVNNIRLLIILTILTLLPSIIVMMTSFIRIIVVFSFLRSAMGTQQSPPNQVLTGLAIFLTIFIMAPTFNTINNDAIKPYLANEITQAQALEVGSRPLREFMLRQTRQNDLKLFIDVAKIEGEITRDNVPMYAVIPAFMISELKTAFTMGFLLFIPFLIIDMVVASVLLSMGMMMLPPVMVSLPFKLLLFVMVDGWNILVRTLIMSVK
jgi:flagellar biosynthetic protein FliP